MQESVNFLCKEPDSIYFIFVFVDHKFSVGGTSLCLCDTKAQKILLYFSKMSAIPAPKHAVNVYSFRKQNLTE